MTRAVHVCMIARATGNSAVSIYYYRQQTPAVRELKYKTPSSTVLDSIPNTGNWVFTAVRTEYRYTEKQFCVASLARQPSCMRASTPPSTPGRGAACGSRTLRGSVDSGVTKRFLDVL